MTESEIEFSLSETQRLLDLGQTFLAAAVWKDEDNIFDHAGFLLSSTQGVFFFEYSGKKIGLWEIVPYEILGNCFIQQFYCIDQEQADTFLARFHLIVLNNGNNIRFGHFYPPAHFLADGTYKTTFQAPLLTTCVGFCLMVLDGLMYPDQFLDRSEWPNENDESETYSETYTKLIKQTGAEPDSILLPFIKHITPTDYFAASFIMNNERTRVKVEGIKPIIRQLCS